ncbi:MAG: LOG family protein, partial [Patescibacteria group bacterium]|nr:LOG family protein [Patescibacteria group bacterium]
IGYNISLPFEQYPNSYISPELNFEFHYFFMRKLWFLYHAKAIVVFPGGYGTLDEFFEVLTLKQTKKLEKFDIPILLCDREFWKDVIHFEKLVEYGLISPEDVNLFHYFSTAQEGFSCLQSVLVPVIKEVQNIVKENDATAHS